MRRCGIAVAQRSRRPTLFTAWPTRQVRLGGRLRSAQKSEQRCAPSPRRKPARARSSFSTPGAEGGSRKHRPSFSGGALPPWVDGSSHCMAPPTSTAAARRRRPPPPPSSARRGRARAAALAELDALGRRSSSTASAAAAGLLSPRRSRARGGGVVIVEARRGGSLAEQRRVDPEGGGLALEPRPPARSARCCARASSISSYPAGTGPCRLSPHLELCLTDFNTRAAARRQQALFFLRR